MGATSAQQQTAPDVLERLLMRLPPRLRPLAQGRPASRRRWRVEVALLAVVAAVIAVAVVYDVTRAVSINYRLTADIETWRHLTDLNLKNVSIETDTKHFTKHDMACGNNVPGKRPGTRTQICFMMVGPIVKGRRETRAGFFVAPKLGDVPRNRWGCFGTAARQHLCATRPPPGAKPEIPATFPSS